MNNPNLALILFAIRELQANIKFQQSISPSEMLSDLGNYYGLSISTPEDLYEALEELAQSLNSGGENV